MAELKITRARKGDLIIVETISRNAYSVAAEREARDAGRELARTVTSYGIGVVASASREGVVKAWSPVGWGGKLIGPDGDPLRGRRCWSLSSQEVDVAGALTAAKAHHWPGHPGQPKDFDTLAEAREVIRPFVKVEKSR
jgi:hypothetical protein